VTIDTFNPRGQLNAVVETPRGSRNKYKYDDKLGLYKVHKLLPTGIIFPFDFGFLPSTRGPDGDPLDVLVLMDEPAAVGCVVPARLAGVIEARQTQDGRTSRNDRLIGVAVSSHQYEEAQSIRDLRPELLDQIETFFVVYNELQGRTFKPLGRYGASHALKLIRAGEAEFKRSNNGSKRRP